MIAVLSAASDGTVAAQSADSGRLVRVAHAAQREFEATRRMHLPWTNGGGGSGGHCDERIGRFCYWHGDTPDRAPPESPTIARARRSLLDVLDSAAHAAPGDGWVAGQRVRYELEAGPPDSALAALALCAAAPWWCDALRGLALHVGQRFADAESTYDRALVEMPDSVRCAWLDLAPLLDGRLAERYAHAGCDERASLNARLWWLAQPFYAVPANDRRTEQFARRTIVEIARHAAWPETASWGDDLTGLILRYGWPRWFERVEPVLQIDPSYSIMGHDPQPSFSFFPDGRLLDSVSSARPGDWDLHAVRATSRYAPAYAESIGSIDMLLSRFERGDSTLIVAGYDASRDSLLRSHGLRVALAVAPDERQRFVRWAAPAAPAGALAVMAPPLDALVDVEIFDDSTHGAARARQALRAPQAFAGTGLSDLLLFRPGEQMPETLSEAIPLALPSAETTPRQTLGLYWELYGVRTLHDPLDVSLTIERVGASWWQRARRALHLGRNTASVALHWEDAARPVNGVVGRSVS
ncbi:MAG: hypothetical protein ACREN3_14900, partial [Gemmatimonadaceae bacterium]